jgi:hypothetical protein
MLRAFVLIVLLAVTAQDCDIGDLKDFVKVYEITVTNTASQAAMIHVSVKDVARRTILAPGASETVTSFSGGSYLVLAVPAVDPILRLKARRSELVAQLDQPNNSPQQITALWMGLSQIAAQISSLEQNPTGGTCGGELKPDADGKGISIQATVTFNGDKYEVACP